MEQILISTQLMRYIFDRSLDVNKTIASKRGIRLPETGCIRYWTSNNKDGRTAIGMIDTNSWYLLLHTVSINVLSDEQLRREYDVLLPKCHISKYVPTSEGQGQEQCTTVNYTITGFVLYERRDLGFRIQYPPYWVLDDKKYYNPYDERFTQVVGFLIPSFNQPGQIREIVSIQIKYLGSSQ